MRTLPSNLSVLRVVPLHYLDKNISKSWKKEYENGSKIFKQEKRK